MAIAEENSIMLTTPQLYARMTRGILSGTWGKTKKEIEALIKKERESGSEGNLPFPPEIHLRS